MLDESIATKGYVIHATETTSLIDLSQIDFDALKAHFEKGRKRTEAEKLKKAIGDKLLNMVQLNKTRTDLMEKFKKPLDRSRSYARRISKRTSGLENERWNDAEKSTGGRKRV